MAKKILERKTSKGQTRENVKSVEKLHKVQTDHLWIMGPRRSVPVSTLFLVLLIISIPTSPLSPFVILFYCCMTSVPFIFFNLGYTMSWYSIFLTVRLLSIMKVKILVMLRLSEHSCRKMPDKEKDDEDGTSCGCDRVPVIKHYSTTVVLHLSRAVLIPGSIGVQCHYSMVK